MRSSYSNPCLAVLIVVTTLSLGLAAPPAAAQYVYMPIPGPMGNTSVQVTGVNDAGTVVGFFNDAAGKSHGFIWTGGTNYTPFDFPGLVAGTFPFGINNAGVIVGSWDDTSGFCHAFSGTIGNFTTLNVFGSSETFASAINNKGEIVGAWEDANSIIHGFTDINGTIASFDFPGSPIVTFPLAVNDFGQIVGSYTPSGPSASNPPQSFILVPNVSISTLAPPSRSTNFDVGGIDDAADIVGVGFGQSSSDEFALFDSGTVKFLTPLGFSSGFLFGLNSSQISSSGGDIVGNVNGEGFLARAPVMIDPVPDLIDGSTDAVSPSFLQSLGATGRRFVKGVAADGVTEAIIRIPAQNAGDQFTITLKNDQNTSSADPNLDGALGNPGDTTFTQGQITVTAENVTVKAPDGSTSTVPFAFAVYHAPIDFVRQDLSGSDFSSGSCPFASSPAGFAVSFGPPPSGPTAIAVGPPQSDDQLACRMVSLQVQDLAQNTSSNLPLAILRPPVIMIHGLWDNWKTWNDFSPLVSGPSTVDPRFSVGRVSYDLPIGPLIASSDPGYFNSSHALGNSLGFQFNALNVLAQTNGWISNFKNGQNPTRLPAAAVQADIVAHSMGGDITRAMVLVPSFLNNSTFGQGVTHKVITIDTPHLGSDLASLLLQPQENGGCIERLLSFKGMFVFNTASLTGFGLVDGAIADLQPSSPALRVLTQTAPHPLPTVLFAGVYTNFSSLDTSLKTIFLRLMCGSGDPLASYFTSSAWPTIFFNEKNDAIVSETSQTAGLTPVFEFPGSVHSPGTESLGFSFPSVLDSISGVPNAVILLLNTPVTSSSFNPLNP